MGHNFLATIVHHHYHRNNYSMYNPNDEPDLQVRLQHKEELICILAVIESSDPNIRKKSLKNSTKIGLNFYPQEKDAHKRDCHTNIHHESLRSGDVILFYLVYALRH